MAFITDKKEIKTQIKKFDDFYIDARSKGISIFPFDIYEYVNSFYSIETIDDDLNYPIIGMIECVRDGAEYGFVITLNKYHDIRRRRTILARLFGHFVLHRDYIIENRKIEIRDFWTTDKMSKDGNDFATKLLIPKATFLEIIKNGSTIGEVSNRFVVTPRFMKYRAYNLGLVKEF